MDVYIDKWYETQLQMPYYGHQRGVFPFFNDLVGHYMADQDGYISKLPYAETNSGSVSNAREFANQCRVITNDLSLYSYDIANAVLGNNQLNHTVNPVLEVLNIEDCLTEAAFCASILKQNFTVNVNTVLSDVVSNTEQINHQLLPYYNQLMRCQLSRPGFRCFNLDLFEFLKVAGDTQVMFMDFAWPWREEGEVTEEYFLDMDQIYELLTGAVHHTEPWDKSNIYQKILKAIELARDTSEWVLLSNQSSNYPDPETLEIWLYEWGFPYERHTTTAPARYEDNLLRSPYFREYLYVIPGESNTVQNNLGLHVYRQS
jgi:hypothetical protein